MPIYRQVRPQKGKRLNSKSDTALGRTHVAGHSVTVKLSVMSRDIRHHTKVYKSPKTPLEALDQKKLLAER